MNILSHSLARRATVWFCAAALGGPALLPPAVAQVALPQLGDTASEDLPLTAERRLGDQVMREIRRDPDYIDDPILVEYLQGIFQRLLAAARQRGDIQSDMDQRYAWEPFLVRDRSVNAFALPGGYVGVHLGLIAMTDTRDELASVLAHEMSHVTQRHIARSMGNSRQQSIIGMAAMLLGILAAAKANTGDAANAILSGGQAAALQGQLNFSRDVEREADRVGFQVMTTAGFSPGGMAAMFEKLEKSARLNDYGEYPYLRSHPLTTERIGEARARMGTSVRVVPTSLLEHTAAQARSRVLMDTRIDALRRWQAMKPLDARSVPDQFAAAYENALACTLLRDWTGADAAIARLQALVPAEAGGPDARARRAVDFLVAQTQLERGDQARAQAAIANWSGDGSRPTALMQARIVLAARGDSATDQRNAESLRTWVALHPSDAEAWALLGSLWDRLGQRLRSLRAEAESRYALGDLPGAVERLRAGQKLARSASGTDFVEASVIDARLRDIDNQRREFAKEEKQSGG